MGYHAVLYCPDEKLARVISQVFHEVDFVVETVAEPFTAVKKLMAQHYDAIVVDCDNDQNSSLLFRSARNSSLNQNSLAIAVVEGQAGVAKAYRIGANLVLTKPINVEQSKGTLRVARGLLKKTADPGLPVAPASSAPAGATAALGAEAAATASSRVPVEVSSSLGHAPQVLASIPSVSAAVAAPPASPAPVSAPAIVNPLAGQTVTAHATPVVAADVTSTPAIAVSAEDAAKAAEQIDAALAAGPLASTGAPLASSAAAAAPAPARTTVTPETEPKQKEELSTREAGPASSAAPVFGESISSGPSFPGPSFAALEGDSEESGGKKKLLIAAAAVAALAVAGYFGWTMFDHPKASVTPPAPVAAPQSQSAPAPQASPAPSPDVPPAPVNRANSPSPSKTTPAIVSQPEKSSAPEPTRQQSSPDTQESQPAPIVVRTPAAQHKAQAPAENPEEPAPSPMAVASPGDNTFGAIVSPDANTAKPTLSRLNISQGVSKGLLIHSVSPKYPPNAVASHLQGEVQIEATITKEGSVVNPKALKGDPILVRAALEAVRQWRYKPYYLDGQPVDIQTQITIKFKTE